MIKSFFKLIYNLTKIPMTIILFKTPIKKKLINYMINYRSRGIKNIFDKYINKIFWEEFFLKLNEEEKNDIRDKTLSFGEGKIWAEGYFSKSFKSLKDLEKIKIGQINYLEAEPIYEDIISYLKEQNEKVSIIQIGSSSGRDLNLIRNYFPEHEYISTDINDEILDFQKTKYKFNNFKFLKAYAQNIDKICNHFNLENKKKLIFSIGSAQYLSPNELTKFISKISKLKKTSLFILEPIQISFLNKKKQHSLYRSNISYNHNYENYFSENGLKISLKKIIEPYDESHRIHGDTAHYYIKCIDNNE